MQCNSYSQLEVKKSSHSWIFKRRKIDMLEIKVLYFIILIAGYVDFKMSTRQRFKCKFQNDNDNDHDNDNDIIPVDPLSIDPCFVILFRRSGVPKRTAEA